MKPKTHEAAAELATRIDTLTRSPAALLLPAPVRQVIRELAALVSRLAVEVHSMTQSNQSIKVLSGTHKGRAGRVVSAYPYDAEGAVAGASKVVDVILDADNNRGHTETTLSVDVLETLG